MSYQICIDEVVTIFSSIAGDSQKANGRIFCRSAIDAVGEMLDEKKDLNGNSYQICYAAACLAFYRFVLHRNTEAIDIKAGDITVNDCSDNVSLHAEKMLKDALSAISHLLKPKRFAFIKTGE